VFKTLIPDLNPQPLKKPISKNKNSDSIVMRAELKFFFFWTKKRPPRSQKEREESVIS
jgi:hypothetical protein